MRGTSCLIREPALFIYEAFMEASSVAHNFLWAWSVVKRKIYICWTGGGPLPLFLNFPWKQGVDSELTSSPPAATSGHFHCHIIDRQILLPVLFCPILFTQKTRTWKRQNWWVMQVRCWLFDLVRRQTKEVDHIVRPGSVRLPYCDWCASKVELASAAAFTWHGF